MGKSIHASVRTFTFQKVKKSNPYTSLSEWVDELLMRGLTDYEKEKLKNSDDEPAITNPAYINDLPVRQNQDLLILTEQVRKGGSKKATS